ncbi:hypothetical protein ABEV55_14660 [Aneurinibacillus thermoaerophilus]|uniref:hypothetical protein n=1 Tax=Aneurinibacillus thermoaerophilus TaxID=143495 RepID=UPI002E224F19|nr:hypothetical protein [Aneurinibacillus thermoaerophilus]
MADKRTTIIESLQEAKSLFSNQMYIYSLRHFYGKPEDAALIQCPIAPDTLNVLLYFLQDQYWDIAEEYPMFPKEAAFILKKLYSAVELNGNNVSCQDIHIIDLHENWEVWTPVGREIVSLPVLQHDELYDILQKVYEEAVTHEH